MASPVDTKDGAGLALMVQCHADCKWQQANVVETPKRIETSYLNGKDTTSP